jgi:CcmD family protein
MPNTFSSLFFGYSAFWLLIAFFIIKLSMDQRKLSAEIKELQQKLASKN